MKRFTKILLALALVAAMIIPAAMGVSAAEKELAEGTGSFGLTCGCGFIDDNLRFSTGWNVEEPSDITVTVNGNEAYWSNSYLGYTHTGLLGHNNVDKAHAWLGIVGADLHIGDDNTFTMDDGTDTYSMTFTSSVNALGTSYAKVTGDAKEKTMKLEVIFNNDPEFAIGTTFEGKVHDEHSNIGTYTVTAYDEATKMYTIEAENYTMTHSILELKVTSEGEYKDYYLSASVNQYNTKISDGGVIGNGKVTITEISSNRGTAANLLDGTSKKLEAGSPSDSNPIEITFKTAEAISLNTMILYTAEDDATWNNRAPKAFKLYGVTADGDVLIKDVADSGMQNVNFTPFAIDIDATAEYDTFKMVITSRIDREQTANYNDWFQLGELEIYTDDAVVSTEPVYEVKTGAVEFNGVLPEADDDDDTTGDDNTGDDNTGDDNTDDDTTGGDNADTGDMTLVLLVVSIIAMVSTAIIVNKRRLHN